MFWLTVAVVAGLLLWKSSRMLVFYAGSFVLVAFLWVAFTWWMRRSRPEPTVYGHNTGTSSGRYPAPRPSGRYPPYS